MGSAQAGGTDRVTVTWQIRSEPGSDVDAVVWPAYAGEPPHQPGLAAFLAGTGFTGAVGDVAQLPGPAGEPVTVLLGFGPQRALSGAAIRSAAGQLARATARYGRFAVVPPPGPDAGATVVRALVEGYLLGGYRFTRHRSSTNPRHDQRIDVIGPDQPATRSALAHGQAVGEAVRFARDLVNEPGGALTPTVFAETAWSVAAAAGLDFESWDAERIAAERLGGLLGVARGSPEPPRLVRLSYRPAHSERRIALVGKGVTFDAGGMSLKPNAQLADMKADMAGAAAVLGAMSVLDAMDCPVAVDGWLPLTENMLGANPIRVGDVLVMRNGTTVEIRNADAEGRLIMADALVLAGETKPDAIVDIATLTDAAAIALGRRIAAVMSSDAALADQLCAAGERAGEPIWPLPLPAIYRRQLESRVADLVNYTIGTRHGTALLAGLFLREFVPTDTPWAHLDIQGTALCDADDGELVAGGTGFGVRILAEFLISGSPSSPDLSRPR